MRRGEDTAPYQDRDGESRIGTIERRLEKEKAEAMRKTAKSRASRRTERDEKKLGEI